MSFLFRVTPYNYYIVIFLEEAQELCAKGIQFRRLYVLQVLTDTTMKNTYHKRSINRSENYTDNGYLS